MADWNMLYGGRQSDQYGYEPNKLMDYGFGPVTPLSRSGIHNNALLQAPPERPADWAVSSGLAETLSPIAQGYGAGQMAGEAYGALKAGDYLPAAGNAALAAMAMVPMAGKGKGVRPEPNALMPKAEAMGQHTTASGSSSVTGGAEHNLSVFDVARQVAKLIGTNPESIRHHPTSFGNSSYLGPYRISDHSVGSTRHATEGPGFDYTLGPAAIADEINKRRQAQIKEMLEAPQPERKPWMSSRDWYEEKQRYANSRPGWLTEEQWQEAKAKHAASKDQNR